MVLLQSRGLPEGQISARGKKNPPTDPPITVVSIVYIFLLSLRSGQGGVTRGPRADTQKLTSAAALQLLTCASCLLVFVSPAQSNSSRLHPKDDGRDGLSPQTWT